MRVALIPTGVMELAGLARSLRAHFGDEHEFVSVPLVPDAPGVPARPFAGFTSNGVDPSRVDEPESAVRLLAEELARQVYPRERRGRDEPAADLAIVIDDLELENVDAEAAVADAFRAAVERHVEGAGAATERGELRRCLREHASFHVISVMAEAWFFADPKSMAPNGVPGTRTPRQLPGVDPEHFSTDDPEYLADDGSACATLLEATRHPRKKPQYKHAPWIMEPDARYPHRRREEHPKHYLEWLCRDPKDKRCTSWREVKDGGEALARLDWSAVLADPKHCGFTRSLFEDIESALCLASSTNGAHHEPLTRLRLDQPSRVLRNL